jgi:hypothetical protein
MESKQDNSPLEQKKISSKNFKKDAHSIES